MEDDKYQTITIRIRELQALVNGLSATHLEHGTMRRVATIAKELSHKAEALSNRARLAHYAEEPSA